jgi:hypothetical protein
MIELAIDIKKGTKQVFNDIYSKYEAKSIDEVNNTILDIIK